MNQDPEKTPDKRGALLDKISALLAKTKDRGCTEAEALTAAELAQKLMTKYGLSLAELQSVSSPSEVCKADGAPIGNRRSHEVLHLAHAIAHYTDNRHWYHSHWIIHVDRGRCRFHEHRGVLLVYFGLQTDVQVAIYLTNTLRTALDTEWWAYWRTHRQTSDTPARTARANFMRGMARRISERLYDMKAAQNKGSTQMAENDGGGTQDDNCRAIVLVKEKIVTEAFEATNIRISTTKSRFYRSDQSAYAHGQIAGDRVTIASGALKRAN